MPYAKYSPQEVEARGEEIYAHYIRPKVEAGNQGKYVVVDIETGVYDVDEDDAAATKRILEKRPAAVLYGLRIGYPTAYSLGGHIAADERWAPRLWACPYSMAVG